MDCERVAAAIRARTLPPAPLPAAAALAGALAAAGGSSVLGVVFFGSRRTQAGFDPWSAHDLFVVTRDYRSFYRGLRGAGALRRPAWMHAALNTLLPPSQLAFRAGDALAKCAVLSMAALGRETSEMRRDHFCIGRLFQPSELVYTADPQAAEAVLAALVRAHVLTYEWVRPWLPARFDAEIYGQTLLSVSLGAEIRPEPRSRARALWEAQREEQVPVWRVLLEQLAAEGELVRAGEEYSLARPVSGEERIWLRVYFAWSLVRATTRWLKHVVTFEGWLDYILRKARRHSGEEIVLTESQRRWPLVLLWPRLFRYLREKERRGRPS